MPARPHPAEKKLAAIALVRAGESQNQVSKRLSIGRRTVQRWLEQADEDPELDGKAQDIAAAIIVKYEQTLDRALDRVMELLPDAKIREAVGAVSVIADKRQLAHGKPTSIRAETVAIPDDATPEQLGDIADELRRRREGQKAAA